MPVLNLSGSYQLDWDIAQSSQEINNNRSLVYGRLILRKISGSGYWTYTPCNWSVNINGVVYSGQYTYDFRNYSELMLWQGTVWVDHNPDGTKSIGSSGYADMDSPSGSALIGRDLTLSTIPRASTGSLSAQPVTGVATTINISRASSSFTHDVKWLFGNASGSIGTGIAGSVVWTPSHDMLKQIPTSATGTGTVQITTKNGGSVIGTYNIPFTLTANANQKPTLTGVTLSEAVTSPVNIASVIGAYVQGQSKLNYQINGAKGIQNSTITGYEFTVGSVVSKSASGVTDSLKDSGTVTVSAVVIDSRGRRSDAWTTTISVLGWSPPNYEVLKIERSTNAGVVDPGGTYLKVTLKASVANLTVSGAQKNTLRYYTDSSNAGANSWTNKRDISQGATISVNTSFVIGTYSEISSFDIRNRLSDRFATTTRIDKVTVAAVALDLGLTNAGIGKFWSTGAADVGGDLVLNAMNGMVGKIAMPLGVIPPRATKQAMGAAGVSYYRAALINAGSGGASILMDFYGGSSRMTDTEYSARIHFRQRKSNSAKVEIWEFGVSQVTWYLRPISEFSFELWVKAPAYDDSHALIPASTTYEYGSQVQVFMDSNTTTAPSEITQTGVIVHPDLRQFDRDPFQVGSNGFTWASGWSNYNASDWTGVWVTREGNLVTINGSAGKSGSYGGQDTVFNVPEGWRPARQIQGYGAQLVGSGTGQVPTRVIPGNAGSTAFSFMLVYQVATVT